MTGIGQIGGIRFFYTQNNSEPTLTVTYYIFDIIPIFSSFKKSPCNSKVILG